MRKEVLDRYPQIRDVLNVLVATFPGGGKEATPQNVAECRETWQALNAKVDIARMEPKEVAREYLREHGLIKD